MSSVNAEAAYNQVGTVYAQGCSGFICALLGKPWKKADSFTQGSYVGTDGSYSGLSPGDIIGFPGHVGVYGGRAGKIFVDVNGEGGSVRTLKSYGPQKVYKYSY